MRRLLLIAAALPAIVSAFALFAALPSFAQKVPKAPETPTAQEARYRREFDSLASGEWKLAFEDECTGGRWQDKWYLDGDMARIEQSDKGMTLFAGEWAAKDKAHAVLWTKQSFEGDVKIEYDFTREDADTLHNLVNIIYIEATGSGEGEYARDIMKWNDLRREPAMKLYFDNMNTYHISYAVRGDPNVDEYIRARRYMPEWKGGLKGTNMLPEYGPQGLFRPGVTYRLTFIKSGQKLYMNVREVGAASDAGVVGAAGVAGAESVPARVEAKRLAGRSPQPAEARVDRTFFFDGSDFPPVTEGYIGLRQMGGRVSTYKNFKVYRKE